MQVLLAAGGSPLSWLIRRLTKEDASHIALSWGGYVLHSNLFGVHWESLESFKKRDSIVEELAIGEDVTKLLLFSISLAGKAKYDFLGLLYCGLRLALRGIGIHLPKKNLWAITGMYLCTELVSLYTEGMADDLSSPRKLFDQLKEEKCSKESPQPS